MMVMFMKYLTVKNVVKNNFICINSFMKYLTNQIFMLSFYHIETQQRKAMNTINNNKNYDHNIDYKFSQSASLSIGKGNE